MVQGSHSRAPSTEARPAQQSAWLVLRLPVRSWKEGPGITRGDALTPVLDAPADIGQPVVDFVESGHCGDFVGVRRCESVVELEVQGPGCMIAVDAEGREVEQMEPAQEHVDVEAKVSQLRLPWYRRVPGAPARP